MKDTRENILLVSLRLFAQEGYEAVSVSQIAGELGLTKGALYRHYANKQAIFESILQKMEQLSAVVLTTSGELKAMLLLLTLAAVAYVASRVIFPREIAETAHEKELEQEEAQAKPAAPAPEEKEEKHEED